MSYRERIYKQYASQFKDQSSTFDISSATKWAKAYRHYLRGWLPKSTDSIIVDLACGSGNFLHLLSTQGYKNIQGVDTSPEQVALAAQVTSNITQADVLTFLKQGTNRFDLITAFDLIEHFTKDEVLQFLDGCHASLKPGGILLLQTPNPESPWGSLLRYGDFTHEIGLTVDVSTRLLNLCGFKDCHARELGPVPWGYSISSTLRAFAWAMIRLGLLLWNMIETGGAGSGILTRVYLISAHKPTSS